MSCLCPPVRVNRKGLPKASTHAWILQLNPPRLRPRAWAPWPPFLGGSGGAGMGPYHGAVNHDTFQVRIISEMMVHSLPDAFITPASKPLVNAVPFARDCWQQSPLSPATPNPEDRLDEASAGDFLAHVYVRARAQKPEDFGPLFIW